MVYRNSLIWLALTRRWNVAKLTGEHDWFVCKSIHPDTNKGNFSPLLWTFRLSIYFVACNLQGTRNIWIMFQDVSAPETRRNHLATMQTAFDFSWGASKDLPRTWPLFLFRSRGGFTIEAEGLVSIAITFNFVFLCPEPRWFTFRGKKIFQDLRASLTSPGINFVSSYDSSYFISIDLF